MDTIDLSEKAVLGGIYNLPGEGFVVELHHGSATYLFDKQGLQHRILRSKELGFDTTAEETALQRINSVNPRWWLGEERGGSRRRRHHRHRCTRHGRHRRR